ncbi:MAG TPA: class I SAM-dependent methyltransferase [Candidatus Binatus sp.]|uniref:SAM-dependent methyltransferase n=1 Tax=Candidatus Binatus sp. TaxID=2811406 RepID=UPI002F415B84
MNLFEFFATIERYHTIQNPTSEEKLDLAIRYCGIRDGMRILDVGCGKGWLMRRIASQFDVQVTGLEIHRTFANEARRLVAAENLANRIEIVEGPALEFHPEPACFDVVMCIGASFALNGFESALDWMSQAAKRGGAIALGEVFAMGLPYPPEVSLGSRASTDYPDRTLWATVETMCAHGMPLRGLVEASTDDWHRYHSLHWQAGMDWALENPGNPDAALLNDRDGMRRAIELDGRYMGWAIFVARNGLD